MSMKLMQTRRKRRTERNEGQNFRLRLRAESREFYSRLSAVQNVDTLPSPYATESLSAYKFFVDRYLLSLHRFPALQNGDVLDPARRESACLPQTFFALQNIDAPGFARREDVFAPIGSLHFADVEFFEEKHTDARLSDAAADRQRQHPFRY